MSVLKNGKKAGAYDFLFFSITGFCMLWLLSSMCHNNKSVDSNCYGLS